MSTNPRRTTARKSQAPAPAIALDNKENLAAPKKPSGSLRQAPKPKPKAPPPRSDSFARDLEMEEKFNIEGNNVADIVYARRDNDAAQARIVEQEAQLRANEAAQAKLMRELDELRAQLASANVNMDVPPEDDEQEMASPAHEHAPVSDALLQERAKNADLQRRLDELTKADLGELEQIPRPAGAAGNNFNIQNEMGLGGSAANREIYKSLLRNVRDLTLQAGIDWERPWSETPAAAKAKLYDVARARHPILANYVNDWATDEMIKQYTKNKRRHGYRQKFLDVPEKFAYLKHNSAKRDPSASRKRRTVATSTSKKAKNAVKAPVPKKRKPAAKAGSSKAKGKRRAVADEEDEAEDEDMPAFDGGESTEED
ncbi:hypothetical protein B0H16DRAFT_1731391 [Mycena metata]|uniref:Uncharacterized protein n=1 Tax=Mycena metata TaxID=1033252 RepID=A0AAD7I6U1_9AGAR|nr:hypothetical protein B0H16DRAFT_1731391 [Mycena metata]